LLLKDKIFKLRLRPQSFWRTRSPFSPEEIRRTERWLATARVFLAVSALAAVWMDPGEVRSIWAYALLDFYILQGTAIMFLLRSQQESTTSFRLFVHGADIIWPAVISLFTTSQSNPFTLFFVFVIAAAAYRWGLWETVMTAASSVGLLWLESLLLRPGRIVQLNVWLGAHHMPPVRMDLADFEPKRLFMRSAYLVVMGLLLGYLADQQKKLRAEKDVATRMLGLVRMDAGLASALPEILGELLRMFGSRRALIASRESRNARISVGILELERGLAELQWMDPGPSGSGAYFSDTPAAAYYARSYVGTEGPDFNVSGLDSQGVFLQDVDATMIRRFAEVHPFRRLMAVSFSFSPELSGRVFLLEPNLASNVEDELHFVQDLARQVGPAVYNLYLLRRLRRRAGALERARLVRELHDGAVQSLIGVEMQVDVLRRNAPGASSITQELDRIQKLLREEVLKLRELMQQMKSSDVDAHRLPGFLRDAVQRFQRETGIAARCLLDFDEISLPQPVCRELARIAQEALVNVRKHSGAKNVLVQLLEANGKWELIVEDDGAGFAFSGRFSQSELDSMGCAPAIIRERVRLIEGELTVESKPGLGSRVEVSVLPVHQVAHG
jgi:signal transduction histidine kinase